MTAASNAPTVNPVPPASGAIPYLVVKGAAEAIRYYQAVFDAREVFRLDAPDGGVMHAELQVGPARFMLTEERPQHQALGPLTLGGSATSVVLYVPDVDATMARAIAAGGKAGMPVENQFWGDRSGMLTDPFGHAWMVATHIEDPTPEQVKARVQAMFEQGGAGCGA
ncbi:VOC family protein [Aquincola sp. MAHUQ-54]|uniref:VOC family protein n=1 Tax=Aquincola agrisoli TaxID=3119538 RepID=A0AAW9PXD5_9BURK